MKFLIINLLLVTSLFSQTDPEQLMDKFFDTYTTKGSTVALDELYVTNPWMERNKDAIDKIKSQFQNLETLVGKYYGRELITKKSLGQSFILYSILVKYDRQPIRMIFQFYKPQDDWRCYSFSFDDNFDDEVEEAAKIYYISE